MNLKQIKVIHAVRCDNCGAFFTDTGSAYGVSNAWVTSARDAKYLKQGLREKAFHYCLCGNPKPSLRKFKEVER